MLYTCKLCQAAGTEAPTRWNGSPDPLERKPRPAGTEAALPACCPLAREGCPDPLERKPEPLERSPPCAAEAACGEGLPPTLAVPAEAACGEGTRRAGSASEGGGAGRAEWKRFGLEWKRVGAAEAALKRAIKQAGKAAGVEAGRGWSGSGSGLEWKRVGAGVEAAWQSVTKKPRQINDGEIQNTENEESSV